MSEDITFYQLKSRLTGHVTGHFKSKRKALKWKGRWGMSRYEVIENSIPWSYIRNASNEMRYGGHHE